MALGAEAVAVAVHEVRVGAVRAVGTVAGKGFHDVELVVLGESGVGRGDRGEAGLSDGGRHCGLWSWDWS